MWFVTSQRMLMIEGANVFRFPACCGKRMIYQPSAARFRCAGCGYVLDHWRKSK